MTTTTPALAQCHACRQLHAHIVDPRCVVCGGAGTVELGPAALKERGPGAVSCAILAGLALVVEDESTPLSARVRVLHDGGLLGNRGKGLPVGDGDDHDARVAILYAADEFARQGGDLGRVRELVGIGVEAAERTRERR